MAVEKTAHGSTRATKPAAKKKLRHIHVQQATNGFIATHHYHPAHGGTPKPDKHVFTDYHALHSHLHQSMQNHGR